MSFTEKELKQKIAKWDEMTKKAQSQVTSFKKQKEKYEKMLTQLEEEKNAEDQ